MWISGYLYGHCDNLRAFEEVIMERNSDHDGTPCLDIEVCFRAPAVYPQCESSTHLDEDGVEQPVYSKIEGRPDALVLVAVQNGGVSLIEEARSFGLAVHMGSSLADIVLLYPEFALGQAIPHRNT